MNYNIVLSSILIKVRPRNICNIYARAYKINWYFIIFDGGFKIYVQSYQFHAINPIDIRWLNRQSHKTSMSIDLPRLIRGPHLLKD